jgi:hypothetical protein
VSGPRAARGLESALWGSKVIDEKHVPGPWEALGAHSNPLIGAAPDMLKALEVFTNYMKHAGDKVIAKRSLDYPLHLAETAIRKAKGGVR